MANRDNDQPGAIAALVTRLSVWLLTHTAYRLHCVGAGRLPSAGPVLLVCNHVSFLDAFLVAACQRRPIVFLVHRSYYEHPALHWLLRLMRAIPTADGSDDEKAASLDRARDALQRGLAVCLFAEGAVSRLSSLLPFTRAFEDLTDDLHVPIVPVFVNRVWGGPISFEAGRLRWRMPDRVPFPVTVAFGTPLPESTNASHVRLALLELGADVAGQRHAAHETLAWHFVRAARRRLFSLSMADSTGRTLTCARSLIAGLLLAAWVREHTHGQRTLGLLLPSSVGGALANIASALAGKISVNLNFTTGHAAMETAVAQCDIKTIITSRQFLEKASLPILPGMVYLEDILPTVMTPLRTIRALLQALLVPASALVRHSGSDTVTVDDTATIIFSSGSTGVPKGIVLTHRNILANLDSVEQVVEMRADDVLIGVLPFFHSFGFTGTLWFPLLTGFAVVYHPNPMDAKTVGDLAERYGGTMLISTPTFCLSYVRKCRREQFGRLRYAIVGAEKLRAPVAEAFREKFGVDLVEGYGCTEMSPVVCANLPRLDERGQTQHGFKPGSVGFPLPGVVAKVVDVETGEGPLIDKDGLLLVKGANRMVGYLGDTARTQAVLRDGWYVTGDIAIIDDDGFIYITDRLSRFSKIGGEMVPHLAVEESIVSFLSEGQSAVVTSIPDEAKGERLVAFYTDPAVSPHALWERLCHTDLPRLWIPKRDDLRFIESIPVLGTGKTDLPAARRLAMGAVDTPVA